MCYLHFRYKKKGECDESITSLNRMENVTRNKWMSTSVLVKAGLMAGLSIVLTRAFSFMIPLAGLPALRIGFGGLPVIISGILFGPFVGAVVGLVADLVGFMINPMGGAYFPGFTISAALSGAIPGFLYGWIRKIKRQVNFNIVNGISIIGFAVGVLYVMVQRNVLTITDQGLFYNGAPFSWTYVLLYALIVTGFVLLPVYLSKFYKRPVEDEVYSLDKITFVVTVHYLVIALTLNTFWLTIMFKKGFLMFLPGRILAGFVMIPLISMVLFTLSRLFKYIR